MSKDVKRSYLVLDCIRLPIHFLRDEITIKKLLSLYAHQIPRNILYPRGLLYIEAMLDKMFQSFLVKIA